ncbi:uncharacterized protein LOC143366829 [Andrena cerasifolii]|uniref:uncharacterized protein LOC143366829 n=1 Tax=Andrena cerasifolii TaxID=2819439 RepID=UPI00403785AB
MKMMDINGQEECCIEAVTPAKKKKMKQAQLSFQTSAAQSPNVLQNKKRKLSSPSLSCRSPKVVKISKASSMEIIEIVDDKLTKIVDTVTESNECIEVEEDVETENLKENRASNKVESSRKNKTPKRSSTGQKRAEKDKAKSSPLTKFLRKSDKEVDGSKEDHPNCSETEKKEGKTDEVVSRTTSNLEGKAEDAPSIVDNSLCYNSDSDPATSSDNEDKEEESKSTENLEERADSPRSCRTPKTDKTKQKKLTPKQLLSAQKKKERQIQKLEKEKKLEEERENRRKEKEEKLKEKEQKLKEKKMKDLKRQMEIEQKQKEKQAKEEERKKREEAKEEEKRKKEEAERKKQKAASTFTSFFVAKKLEKSVDDESTSETKNFMPFEVKADMKVAPVSRRTLNEEEKSSLDEKCGEGDTPKSDLYLGEIKENKLLPRKSSRTWPLETKDEVILIDDENEGSSNIVNQNIVIEKQRTKLLQFSENQRPPYWGTWRKRSSCINPRKPCAKDTKWFNYEVDSQDEWEEEEPGESIRGSDDEKDEEQTEDNEYDVDNEFMVPHGYLSDEELRADEEDKEDMSPETQKFKLKVLGEQFESERNTKTSKLKPKIIGCVWRGPANTFSGNVPQRIMDFLTAHEAWVRQIPVTLPSSWENEAATESGTPTQRQTPGSSKKTRVPREALPDLTRLIHGNRHNKKFLVKEFIAYWNKKSKLGETPISKASLLHKIGEIGKWMVCPEEGPMHLKPCWYISEEIRKEYVDEELPLPNRWSYTLFPKSKSGFTEAAEKLEREDKDREKKSVPLITQFTKKITQEEMKEQLRAKPGPSTHHRKSAQAKTPKRATLISVGRGEQFSKASKDSLVKSFATDDKAASQGSRESDGGSTDDSIIVLEDDERVNETKEELKAQPRQTTPHSKSAEATSPKRAAVVSVGMGQLFSKAENSLVKNIASDDKATNQDSRRKDSESTNDDIIVLDDDVERVNEGDKSDGKGGEDRLAPGPMECKGKDKKQKKSSTNAKQKKSSTNAKQKKLSTNTKQKRKSTPKSKPKVQKKGAKGSVDTP